MRIKSGSFPWFSIAFCIAGTSSFFERVSSAKLLTYYEDDAFYYFQIARNIASHHGSTFDGIHSTNGYHPLWMLVLVALSFLSTGKAFFVLLQVVALISFLTTYLAARAIFRSVSTNNIATDIAAAAVTMPCMMLIESGMEVTVAIPLLLLLLWFRLRPQFQWTASVAVGYGLLSALVVLSRLDAVLFVGTLFIADVALERPASLSGWKLRGLAVAAAAIPLGLYGLSNHVLFHLWMPVSGLAKELRQHHFVTLNYLSNMLERIAFLYRFFILYPCLIVTLCCIAASLRRGGSRLHRKSAIVSLSLIIFPFLQITAFTTTSDWPIWPWYLYTVPMAMAGAMLLVFDRYPSSRAFAKKDVAFLAQAVVVFVALMLGAFVRLVPSDLIADQIEAFSRTHDGIYAMGDCAGNTGYLMRQPLVQLEGLVMDAPFLQNIREQRSLNLVLKDYDVRYYVAIDAVKTGECYETIEPSKAGPDSPHMHGSFCQAPVATYRYANGTVNIFDLGASPPKS